MSCQAYCGGRHEANGHLLFLAAAFAAAVCKFCKQDIRKAVLTAHSRLAVILVHGDEQVAFSHTEARCLWYQARVKLFARPAMRSNAMLTLEACLALRPT